MNPISFASGIVPGATLEQTIAAAHAGRFDGVGLWIEPDVLTRDDVQNAARMLADTGLDLIDVEVIWLKPGPADDAHLKTLDIGAELGARHALVVSSDPDMSANAAKLNALCQHAQSSGMRVALEFGIFTQVKRLEMALDVIKAADHANAALLIDPIHVHRSGADAAALAQIDPHLLPYAQFCDAMVPGPDPNDAEAVIEDAVDKREQLGEGALPLADMYRALPAGIPLSIELRSKALRDGWPDLAERAKMTAEKTRAWLSQHG